MTGCSAMPAWTWPVFTRPWPGTRETGAAPHPAEDPDLAGEGELPGGEKETDSPGEGPEGEPQEKPELTGKTAPPPKGRAQKGGHRRHREYRGPGEYGQLLKSLGSK